MKKPPIRLLIGLMIFMTTCTNYMLRANISVSIVEMIDRELYHFVPACKRGPNITRENITDETPYEKYDWSEEEIGVIMSSYFWGYLLSVIPGGVLSELYGPWLIILVSSLAGAFATGLTPISAELGSGGVIAVRFFVGLFGGVAYPAVNVMISRWAPPKEKGKFLAGMMGNTLGTVIAFNVVGAVTDSYGWKWGFYVLVIIMVVFCVFFALLTSDRPETHRWISEKEKSYISEAQEGHLSSSRRIPPYGQILKSVPFWAAVAAQFGNLWALNMFVFYGPKYMSEVQGYDLRISAGLASLPFLSRLVFSNIFGVIGDVMRTKNIMSVTRIRKLFIIFSHVVPALCLFLITAVGCSHEGVIALLIVAMGSNSAVVISNLINPQDLSPNYAGSVYGMANFFATTNGIFVPLIVGELNDYYKMANTASHIVFSIGGLVLAVAAIIFIVFGSGLVQPWNDMTEEDEPT